MHLICHVTHKTTCLNDYMTLWVKVFNLCHHAIKFAVFKNCCAGNIAFQFVT